MTFFTRISVYEADKLLTNPIEPLLLDIRHESNFDDSHHPKAKLLTDSLLKDIIINKKKNKPIIIYCYHGNSSQDIARMFSEFGFKQCYSVDGGYTAWKNQIDERFSKSKKLNKWITIKGFHNIEINSRVDNQNRTLLMIAAKSGREDIVQELINAGADPNLTDIYGNNALWFACIAQNALCVKKLINADIEVDNQNIFGFTALNYIIGLDDILNIFSNYFNEISFLNRNKKVNNLTV